MKTKKLLLLLIIVFITFNSKAQIVVDCTNERIGLGFDVTSPGRDVHILGTMRFQVPGGNYFDISTVAGYGWGLRPDVASTGILGYQNDLLSIEATHIYGDYFHESDLNLKKNIVPIYDALPLIKRLRPVIFDYNRDRSGIEDVNLRKELETNDKNRLGFIAQEVQQILPQSVATKVADSTLSIRVIDFIPLLVKGMQEQETRIDSLISVIHNLKASENIIKSAQINDPDEDYDIKAKLYQNNPNPFSEQTIINCFVPTDSNNARLLVFNMQGTLVKTLLIPGRNETSVTIAGADLNAGMYIYSLIIDNKEIDSKRMILSN